jgi:DNA repair exonuclease SbcCD ATPase subunit
MAEEKKEKWLNYLALTTVILAVCATLSTFKGGGFSTRSVLTQTQASDQWAYYQSKSIKSYIYEMQKDKLELELKAMGQKAQKQLIDEYEKRIDTYSKKIKKYEEEKTKIEKDARELESIRDDATRHSKAFGMAVIFLQIAILLSSIAALMKKKVVWLAGVAAGFVGLIYFANGFFMFIR